MTSNSNWLNVADKIQNTNKEVYFKEREIWWCHLGFNIGSEENGKGRNFERPILILKKVNNDLFLSVPLTTKNHDQHYKFSVGKINKQKTYVIWTQVRILSQKRLIRKDSILSTNYFKQIRAIIKDYL
jgi:mRNA interferase MazF